MSDSIAHYRHLAQLVETFRQEAYTSETDALEAVSEQLAHVPPGTSITARVMVRSGNIVSYNTMNIGLDKGVPVIKGRGHSFCHLDVFEARQAAIRNVGTLAVEEVDKEVKL